MSGSDRVDVLGREIWTALRELVRQVIARTPGGHLVERDLRNIELQVSLAARTGDPDVDAERFAKDLAGTIRRVVGDAVQHAAAFHPGHAYCHRCRSARCAHSPPPSCRHVFTGYELTGTPRWEEFAQWCLDRKHPDVDRLYEQPPAFLALVQSGRQLQGSVLRAFQDGSYDLLGQVTAGYFPLRTRAEEGRGVLALTLQAAASRSPHGGLRVGLNLLGRAPGGDGLDALWERQDDLPWRRAVRWAQSALGTLSRPPGRAGRRPRRGTADLGERVESILRGLARRLERDQRARGRRTRHAEERHSTGSRPTGKAVDDARAATLDACLIDERSGTLVVLGERGRTHFFTPAGQHVSSVRYSKDSIERKIRLELWRRAEPKDLESLRQRLAD